MLFLLAAGLTLVFGIMDMINLAHGSLYMVGAFLAACAGRAHRLVRRSASLGAIAPTARRSAWLLEVGAAAHALCARPPVAGARHLRADPDPQRRRAHDLRHRPAAVGAGGARRAGRAAAAAAVSGVSPADHRRRPRGRACCSTAGAEDAHRHAGARRRLEPRDGDGDGRRHQAALHARVRHRRGALRRRRRDARRRSSRCRSAWARTS